MKKIKCNWSTAHQDYPPKTLASNSLPLFLYSLYPFYSAYQICANKCIFYMFVFIVSKIHNAQNFYVYLSIRTYFPFIFLLNNNNNTNKIWQCHRPIIDEQTKQMTGQKFIHKQHQIFAYNIFKMYVPLLCADIQNDVWRWPLLWFLRGKKRKKQRRDRQPK